ncbi:MAG: tyrosine-type recombinase/integrase [Sarcina sp.]
MIDTVIMKILGQYTEDFEEQLKLKKILEEVLNDYEISDRCTSLVASDLLDLAAEYILFRKFEGLSAKTLKHYTAELKRFAVEMNKPANFVTKVDLTVYFGRMEHLSKTTVANRMAVIFTFFTWLHDNEKIDKNPTRNIKKPRIPKKLREGLSKEELEIVKDACKNIRESALVEFLSSTGCRIGEIEFLKTTDLDFYKRQATVTGKGNKQRVVFFSHRAKILLQNYLKERKNDSLFLFGSVNKPYKGISIRQLERIVAEIGKRVENRVFPHRLRHTFCTVTVNSGMNMAVVQQLMGHESLATTERYFKISKNTIENEYNRLN